MANTSMKYYSGLVIDRFRFSIWISDYSNVRKFFSDLDKDFYTNFKRVIKNRNGHFSPKVRNKTTVDRWEAYNVMGNFTVKPYMVLIVSEIPLDRYPEETVIAYVNRMRWVQLIMSEGACMLQKETEDKFSIDYIISTLHVPDRDTKLHGFFRTNMYRRFGIRLLKPKQYIEKIKQ